MDLKKFIKSLYLPLRESVNIYPSNFCNRSCIFCKLKGILADNKKISKEMTLENIGTVINFCKRSKVKSIQILGGEPSQYSHIIELIERIYGSGMKVQMLFTNGLFKNSRLINSILDHCIPVNLNYFPPVWYSNSQYKLVHDNMRLLFGKNSPLSKKSKLKQGLKLLSITFYRPDQEYRYLIDACIKYDINDVRWAISERSMTGENAHVPWNKLRQMIPLLISFVKELNAHKIYNIIECSQIVPCVLTKKELAFFIKHTGKFTPFACYPVCDIFPDLSIHYCMGMPIVNWITKTNNLRQVLLDQMVVSEYFRRIPRSPECLKCSWWKEKSCQGYCLQFKYDKNNAEHRQLLSGISWLEKEKQGNKTRY